MKLLRLPLLLLPFSALVLTAQDTRHVTEPVIPKSCAVLNAALHVTPAVPSGEFAAGDETKLDTARLQAALDKCGKGQAVELAPGKGTNAFLSARLAIPGGVTLLVDKGVTLYASRDPRDYDDGSGKCGTVDDNGRACKTWLTIDAPGSAIMGDGVIDARGGSKILGKDETWWQIARRAQVEKARQNCFRLLVANHADGLILYRITLKNSPNFHVIVSKTDGFTAWGVKIDTPADARNTDGIDPSASTNITITHSYIRTGDDNVALKGGNGPVENMSVLHNNFYYGHGMSIGSETNAGIDNLLVEDLSLDGTTAGIRIKSDSKRGGLVQNVVYRNVCLRNNKSTIEVTPFYENRREPGEKIPTYRRIFFQGVHAVSAGKLILQGPDAEHAFLINFDGVQIDGLKPTDVQAQFGTLVIGPGPTNVSLNGSGVAVKEMKTGTPAPVPECEADRFPVFPVTAQD